MEALGVFTCPSPSAGIDAYCHPHNATAAASPSSSPSCVGVGLKSLCRKSRRFAGISSCEFRQNDHLDYYKSSGGKISCGGKKEKYLTKEKEYKTAEKMRKKRLKMLQGLSRDLSMFSSDYPDYNTLFDQVNAKMIAETAVLLEGQLKQLMTEDKEVMMGRKAEKIRLKVQTMTECELSSSSSSESSDSDCGEVVNMNAQNVLKPVIENESPAFHGLLLEERALTDSQAPLSVLQSAATQERNLTMGECDKIPSSQSTEQGCCSGTVNFSGGFADNRCSPDTKDHVAGVSTTKIEVCMGGKCKKSGAAALLGEFQRLVGNEGAVSGCKCMGKCREGPNVRILNDPVKTATNPLCIGVGLEDVDLIIANFIGERSEPGFATAS